MKILVSTTFRDFKKKNIDYLNQKKFIESINIANKHYKIEVVISQFHETKLAIYKKQMQFKHYFVKNKISNKFKYSQSLTLLNTLRIAKDNNYDYIIWCCSDIEIKLKTFHYLNCRFQENTNNKEILTYFPNTYINNKNRTLFGIDFYCLKLSKENILKLIKISKVYKFYDWGMYEHFLFSLSELFKTPIINIKKNTLIIKSENLRQNDERSNQIKSWLKNKKVLEKFLKKNNISLLFARGSMYYLSFKLFKLMSINKTIVKEYFLIIIQFLKKILGFGNIMNMRFIHNLLIKFF